MRVVLQLFCTLNLFGKVIFEWWRYSLCETDTTFSLQERQESLSSWILNRNLSSQMREHMHTPCVKSNGILLVWSELKPITSNNAHERMFLKCEKLPLITSEWGQTSLNLVICFFISFSSVCFWALVTQRLRPPPGPRSASFHTRCIWCNFLFLR